MQKVALIAAALLFISSVSAYAGNKNGATTGQDNGTGSTSTSGQGEALGNNGGKKNGVIGCEFCE